MPPLPLGRGAYKRRYGRAPLIILQNRFFEEDPTNTVTGSALLTRPVTAPLVAGGQGPNRGTTSQAGAFGGDLFFVNDNTLFRYNGDTDTRTTIAGVIGGTGPVEFAYVTGPDFEHLFIADGLLLQVYTGTSRATGTLTLTPSAPPDITTQVIQVGTTYYQWVAASPSPTADGSLANPFEVVVGSDDAGSLENMAAAFNNTGTPGTTYSASITAPNTQARCPEDQITPTTLGFRAVAPGTGGNSIVTAVTSGLHLAFGAGTLTGGGVESLQGVNVPDGSGIVSVASLGGFLVAVTAFSDRWYFIEPGELTINPLDFFTAEEEPDEVIAVRQVGDVLIFFGQSSIEVWELTGIPTAQGDTFLPVQGRTYSFGAVPGTIVKIRDFVMFVGTDNIVYRMAGEPVPIDNNAISENIRVARRIEKEAP